MFERSPKMTIAALALNALLLASCGGGGSFAGSGGTTADKPKPKSPKVAEASPKDQVKDGGVPSPDGQDADQTSDDTGDDTGDEVSASTPDEPLDVSSSGFQCPKDMSLGVGPWSGTWDGAGPMGPLSGTVELFMGEKGEKTLDVKDYQIEGGYFGYDAIRSIAINFELSCGDPAFEPVKVDFNGETFYVTLTFTQQSWSPPTLKGTWAASPAPNNAFPIAQGTWTAQKQ